MTPPYRFGSRLRPFLDLPIHMRPVHLLARRQRYRCKDCKGTYLDPLPSIDQAHGATERLVRYIEEHALDPSRTFVGLARDLGVSENFVRSVFLSHIETLERNYIIETPRYLGIDEIVIDVPWCVLTDLEHHRLIDVLPKRDMETVKRWLAHLKQPERVEVVVMDHWNPYRLSVREVLPHAKIVIDKFHVVRQVNDVVEAVRKSIRTGLKPEQQKQLKQDHKLLLKRERDLTEQQRMIVESWISFVPLLHDLYRLKEAFFGIYDGRSEQDAYERYLTWQESIPPELRDAFLGLELTIEAWGQEIFAFFTTPTALTNAFTESSNRILRDANRIGYGLSLRTLRAKLLFSTSNRASSESRVKRRRLKLQPQEVPPE